MIRLLSTVAAVSILAAPAFAAEVKVNLKGKTAPQAYSTIVRAAKAACNVPGADVYAIHSSDTCVADTVAATLDKLANPALNDYVAARKQLQQLAKL